MFVLDTTTRSLEVLLDAAPATSQLPVVVTYADTNFGGATPYLPASSNTVTNGTTAVTACAAPGAGAQRQVEELTVRNDDTAARVVTLRYNDNGTFRKILTATLQPGETLEYTHAAGLRAVADGAVKMAWAGTQIAQGGGFVRANADGSLEASPAAGKNFTLDNGQLLFTAGSSSTPGLAFSAETTLGFYRAAAGIMGLGGGNFLIGAGGTAPGKFTLKQGGPGLTDTSAAGLYIQRINATDYAGIMFSGELVSDTFFGRLPSSDDLGIFSSNTGTPVQHFKFASNGVFTNSSDINCGGNLVLPAAGWVRSNPGRTRLANPATNATSTFSNLADLTVTLVAGRKYTGRLVLKASNSTAGEGAKIDFNGGAATMTSFWGIASPAGTAGSGGAIVTGTLVSTSLAGVINYTTITGQTLITVDISLVCNAGGTFIVRAAENSAHVSGTLTIDTGSDLWLDDSP